MKLFIVTYTGRNSRFANFNYEVYAISPREAVLRVIDAFLDGFPQENGDILDQDGVLLMGANDNEAHYDGGYFIAQ